MDNEKIIKNEAISFHNRHLRSLSSNVIKIFHELKIRLNDFYSSEYKAIFLDEIQNKIEDELQKHRHTAHDGKSDPNCQLEVNAEKLLFYIDQELETLPKIARGQIITNSKYLRDSVFVSYSRIDKPFLADVKRHFKPFLKQINFWDDSQILPGQKWKEEISKAINKTKVAILLVSTDFLGSEFIANDELPPLLKAANEDGATILIVILRPCLFDGFPELSMYQTMNPPSRPFTTLDINEKEELLVNLVRQTKRILNE